jgi:hypothetical protein
MDINGTSELATDPVGVRTVRVEHQRFGEPERASTQQHIHTLTTIPSPVYGNLSFGQRLCGMRNIDHSTWW